MVKFQRLHGPTQWQTLETHQGPSMLLYPTKRTKARTLTVISSQPWSHPKSKPAHNSKDSKFRSKVRNSRQTTGRLQTLRPHKEQRKLWVLWSHLIAAEEILSWTHITVVMRLILCSMWSVSMDIERHASKPTATSFTMDLPYVTATSNWLKWSEH